MNTIGIDLGTTLSRMAVLDEFGRPVVVENAEGHFATPSIVYFGDNEIIIGEEAKISGDDDPARAVRYAKRYLGTSQTWEIDGIVYTPVDISALILRKLKTDFEVRRGPIDRAVITVPAYFNAHQRLLTVEAAQQAGLPFIDLVNEPVAAALTFVLGTMDEEYRILADMQKLLVFDLGGGTFDLSLVNYNDRKVNVIASSGDLALGGIDWNDRIVANLAVAFHEKYGLDFRTDKTFMYKLDNVAERAKHALSVKDQTRFTMSYKGHEFRFDITRADFRAWTADLIDRANTLTERLLDDANLKWEDLNFLLVVGGSTRMAMIQEITAAMRKAIAPDYVSAKSDPARAVSPDFAIAQGAAHYVGLLTSDQESHANITATLVSTHSLGLLVRNEVGELVNHVVIPRNAPLPAAYQLKVGTVKPNQEHIKLRIVEGEATATKSQAIAMCTVSNLPPNLPEGSVFDVSLMYETSGLLQVIARHLDSGLLASVTVQRNGK